MSTYARALEALGEGTRREIVDLLLDRPRSVGEIADRLPVSRPAVSQHLRVLADASLVGYRVEGTRHVYHLDPGGLAELRAYVERFWARALAGYKAHAEREAGRGRRQRR